MHITDNIFLNQSDSNQNNSTRSLIFSIGAIFLPFIFYLFYIHHFAVNVPYWDEVDGTIPLLEAYDHHALSWTMLWAQHNEHRTFFPSLVEIFILSVTHANTKIEMFFSAFLLLGATLFLFLSLRPLHKLNPLVILVCSMILFSPVQWENSLWGFQVAFYMVIFCISGSIFFLQKSLSVNPIFIIPSIVFSVIGSFSSLQGLLSWIIGGIFLLINSSPSSISKRSLNLLRRIWIFFAVITFILYFHGWQHPGYHPSIFYPFKHPVVSGMYFLGSIGGGAGEALTTSCWIGGILLVGYLAILYLKIRDVNYLLPMSFILFSLFFDLMITFGRSGFGPDQALSSRYTSFNLLGIASLFATFGFLFLNHLTIRNFRVFFLKGAFLAVAFSFLTISYTHGVKSSEGIYKFRIDTQKIACHYKSSLPESIKTFVNPNIPVVNQEFAFLEKKKWSVFYKCS